MNIGQALGDCGQPLYERQNPNPYGTHVTGPQTVWHRTAPSVQEQMGTDPTSKLAAAINRLCDILEKSE